MIGKPTLLAAAHNLKTNSWNIINSADTFNMYCKSNHYSTTRIPWRISLSFSYFSSTLLLLLVHTSIQARPLIQNSCTANPTVYYPLWSTSFCFFKLICHYSLLWLPKIANSRTTSASFLVLFYFGFLGSTFCLDDLCSFTSSIKFLLRLFSVFSYPFQFYALFLEYNPTWLSKTWNSCLSCAQFATFFLFTHRLWLGIGRV